MQWTSVCADGTALECTTTTERELGTNLVTAVVDALSRRTEYTYDTGGRVLTETRLADMSPRDHDVCGYGLHVVRFQLRRHATVRPDGDGDSQRMKSAMQTLISDEARPLRRARQET